MGPQCSRGWRGAGERWGGCGRALASRQWRLRSIVWAMWRVLTGSRKRMHPGGTELGCWGGLLGLGVRVICALAPEHRPPQQCGWLVALLQLGTLENFSSGPSAVSQCNIRCCPNPINSLLCFPHLKSLISSSSWGRQLWCSCMAFSAEAHPVRMVSLQGCGLVWEHLMGFGFLSHFQISGV